MSKNKPKEELEKLGKNVLEQIKKQKNPEIVIPIRALSNINYDEKSKTIVIINIAKNKAKIILNTLCVVELYSIF